MARKPNDYLLDNDQQQTIRRHAEQALKKAGVWGCVPTPVASVLEAAQVVVADEDVLSESFLAKFRRQAGNALRRALSKVLGVLDAAARIIYIDKSVIPVRQTFLKLHETAHAVLPWQRQLYVATEECELTIAPDVSELFEREANAFASEVLFHLDEFSNEANDRFWNPGPCQSLQTLQVLGVRGSSKIRHRQSTSLHGVGSGTSPYLPDSRLYCQVSQGGCFSRVSPEDWFTPMARRVQP